MNTCSPAIVTIMILSIILKLKIRLSVLRTVLKFLFSRVLKYFWFRLIVESAPDSFMMDSSRMDVCSGEVPCLEGSWARGSFSTCGAEWRVSRLCTRLRTGRERPYSDLKIHHLLRKRRHLVVEAEAVFTNVVGREDEVALPLFLAF